MTNGISTAVNNTTSIADVKRVALEAKLAKAIQRAQANYSKVEAMRTTPKAQGAGHIGQNVDISV